MEQIDQVLTMWKTLRSLNKRQFLIQVLQLLMIVCSAVMIWKTLCVTSGSESPVVVVLSGSMEPAFARGDILFLWNGPEEFRTGEVVVFKLKGRDIPIVHRVIETRLEFVEQSLSLKVAGTYVFAIQSIWRAADLDKG